MPTERCVSYPTTPAHLFESTLTFDGVLFVFLHHLYVYVPSMTGSIFFRSDDRSSPSWRTDDLIFAVSENTDFEFGFVISTSAMLDAYDLCFRTAGKKNLQLTQVTHSIDIIVSGSRDLPCT